MASLIYLDTHVVAWLYAGQRDLLPKLARSLIEGNDLLISPMVALELEYLFEIKRVKDRAERVIEALRNEIGLAYCDLPFAAVAQAAWRETWTRDPFDRMIVAQARLRDVPLITKDRNIRKRFDEAVWERARA